MVYLDLLFLSNFLLDASILLFTAHITKERIKYGRIFLGTLVAVSSLVLFLVPSDVLFVILRFLYSMAIVYVAYPFHSVKKYIVNLLIFYALSYLVAGLLVSFNLSSNFMQINFFDPRIWALLSLSFLFAIILTYILKVQLFHQNLYYHVRMRVFDKDYRLLGYFDTGNDSQGRELPLVFVQARTLKERVDLQSLMAHQLAYEHVVFHTLNQSSTTLAFKPRLFEVKKDGRYQKVDVLVALIEGEDQRQNDYQVILNKRIFE